MTKNTNLAITITKVFYTYPDVPVKIENYLNRFHKKIFYDNSKTLWNEITFTSGSASFEEKPKTTDAGIIFEQKLKFTVPGEDDTNTAFFDQLLRPTLVKVMFNKGLYPKLIGCAETPARFERVLKTSAKDSGSECQFTCQALDPAAWIYDEVVHVPDA